MKKIRGLKFEIPNAYGSFLYDILQDINIQQYVWKVDPVESYVIKGDTLSPLFSNTIYSGDELFTIISNDQQYLIFVDLKAFPKEKGIKEIETYSDFLESDCEFVLLVVDSTEVYVYSKDTRITESLRERVIHQGYKNIQYITNEIDFTDRLIAF